MLPTVCVIGAGSSGITAVKALKDAGIPFECFEKSDAIGGNWQFKNKNGMSSAYRSLHINTSRDRMGYADYPMPMHLPTFPHHSHIIRYFNDYVDHFDLRRHINFECAVTHAALDQDGIWRIKLENGEMRRYDALIVADGHHWDPRWPEPAFPGKFDGQVIHSHYYVDPRDPVDLVGKRVVVVGMGNSAMDIACELGAKGNAETCYLSARRGVHIIPRYILGKALDSFPDDPRTPFRIRQMMLEFLLRLAVGKPENYGLPKPDHRIAEAHPTISSEIYNRVGSGDVIAKSNIAELMGDRVRFEDGSIEEVDAIIYCTGYKISFPFLDDAFVSAPGNDIRLFKKVVKPEIPNLFFLALVQPLGAIMPIAEAQSKWIAEYLSGRYALPRVEQMEADISRDWAMMQRRYVASKRHTIQVDFASYLFDLEKERQRGAALANASGNRLPVPARARRDLAEAAE